MPTIFNALPGIDVPVGSISKGLAKMWADTSAAGGPAPEADDAKATQVNFVLHLGMNTKPEDAAAQFHVVEQFAQRYPCRVVVLCPQRNEEGGTELRAKIHGECFLGKSKSDKRCIEFVILSYPRLARKFLESQVSICLSTDLPLYYWAHRFSDSSKLNDYQYLLTRAHRVLIDSAIAPSDALTFPWPKPEAVRDLVYARLLPVRQSLGQFLSRYPMDSICAGLQTVRVSHAADLVAEGRVLLKWLKDRVGKCGQNEAEFELTALSPGETSLEVNFDYGGKKTFSWKGSLANSKAVFEADFGTSKTKLEASLSLLSPPAALSEAMFF